MDENPQCHPEAVPAVDGDSRGDEELEKESEADRVVGALISPPPSQAISSRSPTRVGCFLRPPPVEYEGGRGRVERRRGEEDSYPQVSSLLKSDENLGTPKVHTIRSTRLYPSGPRRESRRWVSTSVRRPERR